MKQQIYSFFVLIVAIIATSACSEHSSPDNPEPTILISEAYDITRTEATIKASIERHGTGLSYVTLHCIMTDGHGTEDHEETTLQGDPSQSTAIFQLTGLKPGKSYSCHLEAGTRTAKLKTGPVTFTTIPNDTPSVSDITPLSTGPLGIILKFSILDTGGEDIIEAGCEIREAESRESRRILATTTGPYPDELHINITDLTPSSSYSIIPFAANSIGETRGTTFEYTTTKSIMLESPGMLDILLGSDKAHALESITIAGYMNGDDFRTLRGFLGGSEERGDSRPKTADIDLTDVTIVEGGGSYDGQRFTVADRLTTGILADCSRLSNVILPNSIIEIESDALARCSALETLTIPARVEKLTPSADCNALKAIEVSGANIHFTSDQGVLLNADATGILWFPSGKTGEYLLPSSITSIGVNAFAGTSITTLIITSSVTTISRGAFSGSALTEIRLPDNLTNVAEGLFQNCTQLTDVYLGSGTEYVGDFAFDGTSIRDIYIAAEIPPFTKEDTFRNGDSTIFGECTLHVPAGCIKQYTNHKQWGSFSLIEEFQP
ncbi:MAG: leucine-rich repeat domain-containing protein [Muribaculaceae bacterium]|nr:leucine-rich repeat domain-containing protein [Muribaculaceae bacterium]